MRVLILAVLLFAPGALAQFDRQPEPEKICTRRLTIDGWKVDVWATGVEVHTTDDTLKWSMPEGYRLQGIKGITLWEQDGTRKLTFRLPLLFNGEGQQFSMDDVHASPLSVVLSENSRNGGYVRTAILDKMSGENGFYHLTDDAYTKTKFNAGKSALVSLDFDFHNPNPMTANVYMRASLLPTDARRGFTLWDDWENWRKGGCHAETEPQALTPPQSE